MGAFMDIFCEVTDIYTWTAYLGSLVSMAYQTEDTYPRGPSYPMSIVNEDETMYQSLPDIPNREPVPYPPAPFLAWNVVHYVAPQPVQRK